MSFAAALAVLGPLAEQILVPVLKEALASEPPATPAEADAKAAETAATAAPALAGLMALAAADAASADRFRAWWRPAFGWVAALAVAHELLLRPYVVQFLLPGLPPIDTEALWAVVGGLLGLAGLRSFEKAKGVADPGALAKILRAR